MTGHKNAGRPEGRGRGHDSIDAELHARRLQALDLAAQGYSVRTIAAQLGIAKSTAHEDIGWAMAATMQPAADQIRALEIEKLDALEESALGVQLRDHVVLYQGEPVEIDGRVVLDDGPRLQAIDRRVRIADRRARLLGLDAPTRSEVTGAGGAPLVDDGMIDRMASVIRAASEAAAPAATPDMEVAE